MINMDAESLLEAYAGAYEACNYWTREYGEDHPQAKIHKEREECFKAEILRRVGNKREEA